MKASGMWNTLGALTSAIQDGVKEFSDSALGEVKTLESELQSELEAITHAPTRSNAWGALQPEHEQPSSPSSSTMDSPPLLRLPPKGAASRFARPAGREPASPSRPSNARQPAARSPATADERVADKQVPSSHPGPASAAETIAPSIAHRPEADVDHTGASQTTGVSVHAPSRQATTPPRPNDFAGVALDTPISPRASRPAVAPRRASPPEQVARRSTSATRGGDLSYGGNGNGAQRSESEFSGSPAASSTPDATDAAVDPSEAGSEGGGAASPPPLPTDAVTSDSVPTSDDGAASTERSRSVAALASELAAGEIPVDSTGAGAAPEALVTGNGADHAGSAAQQGVSSDAVAAADGVEAAPTCMDVVPERAADASSGEVAGRSGGGGSAGAVERRARRGVAGGDPAVASSPDGSLQELIEKVSTLEDELERERVRSGRLQRANDELTQERQQLASEQVVLKKRVAEITNAMESRMQALNERLESGRSSAAAVEQLGEQLEHAQAEARRLREAIGAFEATADEQRALADARQRDLGAAKVRIAELQAELSETKEHALGSDEFQAMRKQVVQSVAQVKAAVQAKEAAEARMIAAREAARSAEDASRAADERRRAAEVAAQAAQAAADEARAQQAAAHEAAEALHAESERRAKAFNSAVKAAVARVQSELEAQRDALAARLEEAQAERAAAVHERDEAWREVEAARRETDAHDVGAREAGEAAAAAEDEAARMRAKEQLARAQAQEAQVAREDAVRARAAAEQQLAALEQQLAEQQAAAAAQRDADASALQAVMAELRNCQDDLLVQKRCAEGAQEAAARAEAKALGAAEARAAAVASAMHGDGALEGELREARERLAEMQRELADARRASRAALAAAGGGGRVPAEDVLDGLGLDALRDDRLGEKGKKRGGLRVSADVDSRMEMGTLSKARGEGGGAGLRGRVPLRFWVIAGYLVLLHFCLMLQFTQRRALPCDPALPGLAHTGGMVGDGALP